MLAVKSANIRDNFKEWCDKISMGETVVISRPRNENIYMINEAEYNALQKAKRNAEYLKMIEESEEQFKKGDTISFTLDELKEMENEDWKPNERILEFEKSMEYKGRVKIKWLIFHLQKKDGNSTYIGRHKTKRH